MAKVKAPFRDRVTWRAYGVGDEYVGTPERVAELAGKGLVEAPEPEAKPSPKRRQTRRAAPKE